MPCINEDCSKELRKASKKISGKTPEIEISEKEAVIYQLRNECNKLTNLLCMTGRARHNKTNIPQEVIDWWKNHCKQDEERGEPW
jgi:hypothetical protein